MIHIELDACMPDVVFRRLRSKIVCITHSLEVVVIQSVLLLVILNYNSALSTMRIRDLKAAICS